MNRISTNPPYSTNFLKYFLPKTNRANTVSVEIIAAIIAISLKVKPTFPPPARKHSMLSSKGRNFSCLFLQKCRNIIQKKFEYLHLKYYKFLASEQEKKYFFLFLSSSNDEIDTVLLFLDF